MTLTSALKRALACGALLVAAPVAAQDIRGLETCTAEKQVERRTGCLQANIELLQQRLAKLAHESSARFEAVNRDLAATRGEIATLRSALGKLEADLAAVKAKESKKP